MFRPDMVTVALILVMICLVSTIVTILIWRQYHLRYKGTSFWIAAFSAQVISVLLIFMTGILPSWMTILLANTVSMAGIIFGFQGLLNFTGKTIRQTWNYLLLAIYIFIESWFTFKNPDSSVRSLNSSVFSLILFTQCAWLLLPGVRKCMRAMTMGTGLVFTGFALLSLTRITGFFLFPRVTQNFSVPGRFETVLLIAMLTLVVVLTYSLILMYSGRLHQDIKAEEQKFSIAFHTAPYCVGLTRLNDGLIQEVNDGFVTIFGYTKEAARGKTTVDLEIWVSESERQCMLKELIENRSVQDREYSFRRAGGSVFIGAMTARLITLGPEIYILSSITDITEKKRADDIIKSNEEKFRDLFENSPSGNSVSYLDGTIEVNNSFCKMTGYTKEELTGISWSKITHPDDIKSTNSAIDLLLSGEREKLRMEKRYIRKNGTILHSEVSLYLHRNSIGEPQYLISTINDISERIAIENAMRKMNGELELRVEERTKLLEASHQKLVAVNKDLEAFTYSVSHDLRAPLRAIDGYTNMLNLEYTGKFGKEGDRLINSILRNTKKMGTLIDDLLTLSRVGRSQIKIIRSGMRRIAESVYLEITENREPFRIDFQLGPLHDAMCDPGLIRQVWMNLVSNAIKFSSKSDEIRINISSTLEGNFVIYSVSDNGVGFDMKYYHKLFGVFERLHRADEFEGTGVGLAIVKRIIGKHGGEVWAESKPGNGTTFSFSLPCVPVFQM